MCFKKLIFTIFFTDFRLDKEYFKCSYLKSIFMFCVNT